MDLEYDFFTPVSAAAVVIATTASPGSASTLAAERWQRTSLLLGVVARLAELGSVVVVVRDESQAELLTDDTTVTVIVDEEWEEGRSAPLRAGLDWLTRSSDVEAAFVISLASPDLDPAVLDAMRRAHAASDKPVTVPKYRYVRGGPVLLDRTIWPRFLGAEGDADVEHHMLAHPQWVHEVRVDVAAPRRIVSADDLLDLAT